MAVPIFVLISFLVSNMSDIASDNSKILKRYKRLLIPHVFFSISTYMLYCGLNYLGDFNIHNSIYDLLWQLIFGANINGPLWFWITLLIITSILLVTLKVHDMKIHTAILISQGLFALIMQYTGMNLYLFGNLNDKCKWTLGRVCELYPYAIIGFVIINFDLLKVIKKHRYFVLVTTALGLIFYDKFPIPYCEGFYYQGLYMIGKAILIVLFFYCIPFEKLNYQISGTINLFSKYTMGIIAIHYPVKTLLDILFFDGKKVSFSFSWGLLHYLICFMIVLVGSMMPNQVIKKAFV